MALDTATARTSIRNTTSQVTWADRWDHLLARFAYRRSEHRVEPGLYSLGRPTAESPVFVTANYKLSFDALRSALAGRDGHILVLDTQGINVWCAAGKGTFGTDELVHQIEATGLSAVVSHRVLILPQLGAPGVAAHEVKRRSGFKVEYGPVRAVDLPTYLATRRATSEMRRVRYNLVDRLVVVPVDLVAATVPLLVAALASYFLGGLALAAAVVAAVLAGVVLFPIVLPWLPTRDFSSKGFVLGFVVALPFALARLFSHPEDPVWDNVAQALFRLAVLPSVTAFLALNFTGSTTFTSRSGVKREIRAYVPVMAGLFVSGIFLTLAATAARSLGGW